MRRRAARIARPARVRIRTRKPCLRARRRLFGWKVRLLTVSPVVQRGASRTERHSAGQVECGPYAGRNRKLAPFARAGESHRSTVQPRLRERSRGVKPRRRPARRRRRHDGAPRRTAPKTAPRRVTPPVHDAPAGRATCRPADNRRASLRERPRRSRETRLGKLERVKFWLGRRNLPPRGPVKPARVVVIIAGFRAFGGQPTIISRSSIGIRHDTPRRRV